MAESTICSLELLSTLSRQSQICDSRHTISVLARIGVERVFFDNIPGSNDPFGRDSHGCHNTGGLTVDNEVSVATTVLLFIPQVRVELRDAYGSC